MKDEEWALAFQQRTSQQGTVPAESRLPVARTTVSAQLGRELEERPGGINRKATKTAKIRDEFLG